MSSWDRLFTDDLGIDHSGELWPETPAEPPVWTSRSIIRNHDNPASTPQSFPQEPRATHSFHEDVDDYQDYRENRYDENRYDTGAPIISNGFEDLYVSSDEDPYYDDDPFADSNDDSEPPQRNTRSTGKREPGKKKNRGIKAAMISVLAVFVIAGGGLAYAWVDLSSRLNTSNIDDALGTDRPDAPTASATVKYPGDPYAGRPMNILVMGTDSREGENDDYVGDGVGGARSDTTFIAHVSADRDRVDVISIPRDIWITIPDCVDEDGDVIPEAGWSHMGFNAAFAYGVYSGGSIEMGAACAIRAVEEMSGVRIDRFVVVDFSGFVGVVDAIDGVDVTLLCPMSSWAAGGLNLPAGVVHLDGKQAINVARARKGPGLGDGSDLHRIYRQQRLFDAILMKIYQMNYVTDFRKLYNLVGAAIESVTTDLGSLSEIAGFAYSLKNLDMRQVTYIMVPIGDAGDRAHVVVLEYKAEPIWEAIRNDQPLPQEENVPTLETGPLYGPPAPVPTEEATNGGTKTDPNMGAPPTIQRESDCD